MTVYKYNWNNICWHRVESLVFQWQYKIYQASISNNKKRIYFFQSKLIRSNIRKLITIRRGTNNFEKYSIKSRHTYFIFYDENFKIFIKNVICKEKSERNSHLYTSSIIDSYNLLLINLILEPEWERQFSKCDQNSYNFRTGFQYHDIIENVRKQIRNPTYFISIRTNKINISGHTFILEKIHINPKNYSLFRNWFKEKNFKKDTKYPFFKNIVIHGIEVSFIERIGRKIKYLEKSQFSKWIKNFCFVRFNNNLIVFSPNRNTKKFQIEISKWLIKVGFNLQKNRLRICHSRRKINFLKKKVIKNIIFPGFTLCGFFFQHSKFKDPVYFKKNTNPEKRKICDPVYVINITPSKEKLKQHLNKLSYFIFIFGIQTYYRTIIENINPIIWNWCNYFRYYNCKARFRLRQYITFCILKKWSKQFVRKKIFRKRFRSIRKKVNNQSETTTYLNIMRSKITRTVLLHTDFTPKIFIQVNKKFSIFNENSFYFNKRFCIIEKLFKTV